MAKDMSGADVVAILSDYPRQTLAAHLTAILSFIQEKRKKKGLFSRKEEVVDSIRVGYIPLEGVRGDGFSVVVDRLCALEPEFSLEDVGAWESALSDLRAIMDHRTFASRLKALSDFRPPVERVTLRGIAPSFLFPLLTKTAPVQVNMEGERRCEPTSSEGFLSAISRLDDFERRQGEFQRLASGLKLLCDEVIGDLDSWLERYPPDSPMRREYQEERRRISSSCSSLTSRLEGAARAYGELVSTLRSAPPLKQVLLPVYRVQTRGKASRRFLISNLRFKRPGLTYKIKDLLGRFDSLFEETGVSRRLASILRVDAIEWGPNLLTEDMREEIYGELAALEEEGFADEEYADSIAELISKSLLR